MPTDKDGNLLWSIIVYNVSYFFYNWHQLSIYVCPTKELWEMQIIRYCCLYSVTFNFPINSAWKIENIYSVHVLCFSSESFYCQNVRDTCRLYYCSKEYLTPKLTYFLSRQTKLPTSLYIEKSVSYWLTDWGVTNDSKL